MKKTTNSCKSSFRKMIWTSRFLETSLVAYLLCVSLAISQTCNRIARVVREPLVNAKLEATKIKVLKTWSDADCIHRCFRISGCNGVNTKVERDNSVICEISSFQSENYEKKVIAKNGWKFYNLKQPSICDQSGQQLCRGTQRCIDDAVQPQGYRCVDLENIAYKKTTKQSSNFSTYDTSSKAVDGNKNPNYYAGSCSHTSGGANTTLPWWRVDFGKQAVVSSVKITNRVDCCSERLGDFDILVGNEANGGDGNNACQENQSMTNIVTKSFQCPNMLIGRYLFIRSKLNPALTLCEVEVYGTYYKDC